MIVLITITRITLMITILKFSITKERSRSIPIETKKKLANTSFTGRKFPKTLWLYSDSEIISPARKAPNARDIPSLEVNNAIEKQIRKMLIINNSWFFVIAIRCNNRGRRYLFPA
jgi:hypothetical protein